MRNSTGGTSSAKRSQQNNASTNDEKNSAKKLVQARLPFKVIAPGSSSSVDADAKQEVNVVQKDLNDTRKRKLSYESDDDAKSGQELDNVSKENVEVIAAANKKKKVTTTSSEIEVVSLLDDDDNEDLNNSTVVAPKGNINTTLKTPNTTVHKGKRVKGAGTPQSSSAQKDKKEQSGSASKLQIKLPLSAGKKGKRRKSKVNSLLGNTSVSHDTSQKNDSCAESSDDIEEVSIKQNPQKRTKLDYENEKENDAEGTKENGEAIPLDSEAELENPEEDRKECLIKESLSEICSDKLETKNSEEKSDINERICEKSETKVIDPDESVVICSDDDNVAGDDGDDEADDETESTSIKNANVSSDISDDSKSKHNVTIESIKETENGNIKNKNLTPKQKKLMEQRQKVREEKERKLQEERRKKQQDKEEKEMAKKREREEKEEQKRREREEKEDQKRKEREEKERKRLAEVEAKNEEKRKRNEAKEEEIRKKEEERKRKEQEKEEERKRKEQEKEEAELKKKKAAEAFTKFFVAKAPSTAQQNIEDDENTGDGTKALAFRPFQIKGDMKLAPLCRKIFTEEAKHRLDSLLGIKTGEDSDIEDVRIKPLPKSKLYISELRSGKILPGKWRRPSTESKDDVIIIEDELERVGEAIVEDTPAYVREQMRVKFYKFHDNRRPPYYGTWRKKSSVISAKKPFAQDKKFFDYEVDSDDEWEEEEPGESLEDGSDDDKEKESEDDDYEVDNEWFVPHGHLSDEEIQNEDELGNGDDNTREAQKAKLQILQQEFAQEMKKKTQKIKPRLIGCIWVDVNGNQPTECPKIIWDTLNVRAMMCTEPPILDEPEVEEPSSPSASNIGNSEKPANDKIKPITVTDEMWKDLVRLLHGNQNSKNFLIKEYIAYVEKTEETIKNGEFGNPLKTAIREKIDSIAEWQVVDAATATKTSGSDTTNEGIKKAKKKNKKRLCWVVNQATLEKMDMTSLGLQNTWEYILKPKLKMDKESTKPDEPTVEQDHTTDNSNNKTVNRPTDKSKNTTPQIKKFTKTLTSEEIANKLEKSKTSSTSEISPRDNKKSTDNKSKPPAANNSLIAKEKKRVPLLMSVGRGQQISTPAKNKLISQFLQKNNKDKNKSPAERTSPVVEDDDVVILD